jgi:transposase
MAVSITRTDHDAAGLRQAASRSKDADAARRMLALALVLEGRSRTEAAQTCGMDRQTLRDWVHRFNEHGLAGLSNRKAPGAKPRLSPEHEAELAALVRSGPDLAEHGVIRWRRIDLSKVIEDRFGVRLAERSVGAVLARLGFRHVSVRPHNPVQDKAAIEAHKKTSPRSSPTPYPSMRGANRSSFGGRMKRASASKAH